MSNIKARLMKPTGQDFLDVAYDVDREIWNFLKHTFKKATGGIPARYWQTHAVPKKHKRKEHRNAELLCG